MGGKVKNKHLILKLITAILFPFGNSFASVSTQSAQNFSAVEVLPMSDIGKYGFKPHEYWIQNTKNDEGFPIEPAQKFYKNLYNTIVENYVNPISHQEITNIIFEALSNFAEKLTIETTQNRILIYDKNLKAIGNFKKEAGDNSENYANILTKTILSLRENSKKMKDAHQEQIFYATAYYLIKTLDENGSYLNPVLKERDFSDNSTSLGFSYRRTPSGIQVLSILKDSPVYFSDIKTGDIITGINKIPVKTLTDEQLEYILTSTDTDLMHIDYVSYTFNKPSNTFIRKNRIVIPSITVSTFDNTPVIEIHNFKYDSSRELKQALDNAKTDNGIIIDLRGNLNGIANEAIESANLFISGGDILTTTGNNEYYNETYTAKNGDILNDKPIIIIADNTTKGPAEIFASIMDGTNRAVIIGTPTFGNGNIQETFTLQNDSSITFTTSRAKNAKNISIDKIGVIPIVCATSIIEEKDIDTLISNINSNKFVDNRLSAKDITPETINKVRKACLAFYPTPETNNLILKTATKILKDTSAYKKLIAKNN